MFLIYDSIITEKYGAYPCRDATRSRYVIRESWAKRCNYEFLSTKRVVDWKKRDSNDTRMNSEFCSRFLIENARRLRLYEFLWLLSIDRPSRFYTIPYRITIVQILVKIQTNTILGRNNFQRISFAYSQTSVSTFLYIHGAIFSTRHISFLCRVSQ